MNFPTAGTRIRDIFVRFGNPYGFWVSLNIISVVIMAGTGVWMGTTNSVASGLLQELGPVSRLSQDPRVEPYIPLNAGYVDVFRHIEVQGWEWEFGAPYREERFNHTLGILSLHNGGTYRIDPLTAPVTFISALEAAAEGGVVGTERFLLEAGKGESWRDKQSEEYQTVVIDLVPNKMEGFLFKAFIGSVMIAIPMSAGTFILKLRLRQ